VIVSKPAIILASQSPRRRALLAEAGYEFEVCPPAEEAESESTSFAIKLQGVKRYRHSITFVPAEGILFFQGRVEILPLGLSPTS